LHHYGAEESDVLLIEVVDDKWEELIVEAIVIVLDNDADDT